MDGYVEFWTHVLVVGLVVFEVVSHTTHHLRKRRSRKHTKLYTLEEAKQALFTEVVARIANENPAVYQMIMKDLKRSVLGKL